MKAPEATRRKLLEAAFAEFYATGFQGGSLSHIVEAAGATKGALFHHFESKQALGYAVLDELIGPLLLTRWLDPVQDSTDPLTEIQRAFTEQTVTDDPLAASLQTSLDHAVATGLLKQTDLHGIFDLTLLDTELARDGRAAVSDAGLSQK